MLPFISSKRLDFILKTPLYIANAKLRHLIKLLMICFGHLIHVVHEERLFFVAEPIIFVFNHNSTFETFMIALYLVFRRQGKMVSFVIDWMYGVLPGLSWLFRQCNPIYVYNKPSKLFWMNRKRKILQQTPVYEQCIARLNAGRSIAIFPEGTRNPHPVNLKRGRKGVAQIVLETGFPIIPIGIDFPLRIKTGKVPKFGHIIFRIGTPLRFMDELHRYQTNTKNQFLSSEKVKGNNQPLINQITYQIMQRLADLSNKKYPYNSPESAVNQEQTSFTINLPKEEIYV